MKTLILFLILSLISSIFGDTNCALEYTYLNNVSNFEDCKGYTKSKNKICCYVNGYDDKENQLSGCQELTGTVKGALNDLQTFESYKFKYTRTYLEADCNLEKKISLCDPDDRKSYTPLSADFCSKSTVVRLSGVDEDSECCYVTGVSVDKKNVYSCIGIDNMFYTINSEKENIEVGKYTRLGALNNVNIICGSSYSYFHSLSIISIIFALLNLL